MAPGTSIGAASPVGGQGEDIGGTIGEKVKNDAIAKITAIAEERGRNVAWAVSTVSRARSSPASEAVELGAVDGIAATIEDVLAFADGKEVEVAGQTVTLDTADATTTEVAMSPFQSFIRLLSDPTIAFLLFSIGSAGLLAELYNPNFVTGILGGLAIILAFIGLGTLPLNVGGRDPDRLRARADRPGADRHQPRPAWIRRRPLHRPGGIGPVHDAGRPVRAGVPRRTDASSSRSRSSARCSSA